jgi:hypothetical protein
MDAEHNPVECLDVKRSETLRLVAAQIALLVLREADFAVTGRL